MFYLELVLMWVVIILIVVVCDFVYGCFKYLYYEIRSRKVSKVAQRLGLKYEKNFDLLTFFSPVQIWRSKTFLDSPSLKINKISGIINGHNIEAYDVSYIAGGGKLSFSVHRTVFVKDGNIIFNTLGHIKPARLEEKLKSVESWVQADPFPMLNAFSRFLSKLFSLS